MNSVKKVIRNPIWGAKKLYLFWRSYFNLKENDVILALFPKTGSTWVRYFLYNLLCIVENKDKNISIDEMNRVMPEFGHPSLFGIWPFKSCPRVIKTHRAKNFSLNNRHTVLVIRDPRDVVVSFYHYSVAKKEISYQGSIKDIIYHDEMGLLAFFQQYNSWRLQAELVLRYEDLKSDTFVQFKRLVDYLGIEASDEQIQLAIERSSMKEMRKAQENSRGFKEKFDKDFVFARSGAAKQWEGLFDSEDLAYWKSLKKKYDFDLY